MGTEAVREKNSVLYEVGRYLFRFWFRTFQPVRYHGIGKLKSLEGPAVVISNHVHALDPIIIALPIRPQCVFLGKKELGKNTFIRNVLTRLHCILVDRHSTDMEAMRACMKAIRMKKPLVIFPEGTRHHEGQMEQIENGTSMIVLRSGVPLIPVYLDRPLAFFRRVNAWVGDPIAYDDLKGKGVNTESCEALNERMRETFRSMIRESGQAENPGNAKDRD